MPQNAVVALLALLGVAGVARAQDCALALREPKTPRFALKFCHIFPDESCCSPAQDAEIEEHYFTLLDAGDICAKESSLAKDALKEIFCFGCSPLQPDYVVPVDDSGTNFEIRVCDSLWQEVSPSEFDDCGMVMVEERGAPCAGDDTVVPSEQWATTEDFLNSDVGAKPPFFEDGDETYTVVRVTDNTDCYAGSFAPATAASLMLTLGAVLLASVAVF